MRYNNYSYDEGATARRSGAIATIIYFVVVVLALWLTRCDTRTEEEIDNSAGSILISFGESNESMGEIAKSTTDAVAPTPPPAVEEEVATLTDESSDVELPQPEVIEPTKVEEVTPEPKEEVAEEPKPEPIREVNKRALFPGKSVAQSASAQGSGKVEKGVEGTERGTPSTHSKLGDGLTGDYSLVGRSLIGALPVPGYNTQSEGRVVMQIMVDEKGRVTSANLQPEGTTTNNSRLISAAREAALKARFTQSEEFIQGGTITYIFKMN